METLSSRKTYFLSGTLNHLLVPCFQYILIIPNDLRPTCPPVPPSATSLVNTSPSLTFSVLKRSTRASKPLIWLDDYVLPSSKAACLYPMSKYVSYFGLLLSYRESLSSYSAIVEPHSYMEACRDPLWLHAMKHEIAAL